MKADKGIMRYVNRYMPLILSFTTFVLILAFQNMSLVEFTSLNIAKVDEDARRDQARELLGAYYKGSVVQKLEGQPHLNYLVYKKIEQSFKQRWKSYVPAVAQTIISESRKHEFDPVFILAVIQTESSFKPDARGSSGEIGLMQILPRTGEWIAKKYRLPWKGKKTLYDPVMNVRIGIQYFAHLRSEFGRMAYHYLPAYNMGPANVRKIDRKYGSFDSKGRVQKRQYAMRVMKNYFDIYERMAMQHKEIEHLVSANDANESMDQSVQ